jgi:predicted nucleotidyltransferase
MKLSSIEAIVAALNEAGVEYLVAGGIAVNAHGYGRATFDIDLVVDLGPENVELLFRALAELGFQPLVPVDAESFADQETRHRWVVEKGMQVLQFWSDQHRETRIDVFASEPFDFPAESARAIVEELRPGLEIRFVSLETLIEMKVAAGRPKDLDDVEQLRLANENADADQ